MQDSFYILQGNDTDHMTCFINHRKIVLVSLAQKLDDFRKRHRLRHKFDFPVTLIYIGTLDTFENVHGKITSVGG